MNRINQSNLVIPRNQGKAATYGAFETGRTAVNLTVSVLPVMAIPLDWEGASRGC